MCSSPHRHCPLRLHSHLLHLPPRHSHLPPPPPRVGREEGRKRHSQTLNIDLNLPDRGPELGLESIHKARGPGAEARHRRRSLFVEPDPRGEQQSFARGAYVRMKFSSASRVRNVAERSDISLRSPSLPGYGSARHSHHARADLTNRRRIEIL